MVGESSNPVGVGVVGAVEFVAGVRGGAVMDWRVTSPVSSEVVRSELGLIRPALVMRISPCQGVGSAESG